MKSEQSTFKNIVETLKSTSLAALLSYFGREWILTAFGFVISIVALAASVLSWMDVELGPRILTATLVCIGVLVGAALVRFMTVIEPIRERMLEERAKAFHTIAHAVRDGSVRLLQAGNNLPERERLALEKGLLDNVTKQIADLFTEITGVPCRARVSMIAKSTSPEKAKVFTWATSDSFAEAARAFSASNIEDNTQWKEALKESPSGRQMFFAGDLLKLERAGEYKNDTPGWQDYYRSTLVVPITAGGEKEKEVLGFLSVDTSVPHRLNDRFHPEILAAFADQVALFNLLAKRTKQVGEIEQEAQV